jgi:hypothetical protein
VIFFRFAEAFLAFIFEDADMLALLTDQNKPEVVMDFRQEQAGLGGPLQAVANGVCVHQVDVHHEPHCSRP